MCPLVLVPDQSLQLLIQEANRQPESETEWAAARKIADLLDGLPLALEMAGAYLARRPVGWQDYLDLLQHNLKHAFTGKLASLTNHKADLYLTLQVSASVFSEEPRLKDTLNVLTWSATAPMSADLLVKLLGVENRSELTGALGLGTALRLLQQTHDTDAYAIHRLVREVRREQTPLVEKNDWAKKLCEEIGDWFYTLREDFQQLPHFEANIDHLQEWHGHALQVAPQQASRLTWLQAYPSYHRAQAKEIRRLIALALNEYETQASDDPSLQAHLYSDQAFALNALGDPKHALELAEQALAIRRELFGERHPDTAQSLDNVAGYVDDLGDPKRALALAEQAFAIRRDLFGERHPDTARSLNNVSTYVNALGDPKHALELTEQALAIRRELFGECHPKTATSLNNVAIYVDKLGDLKRALAVTEQALEIRRELFGERHPNTASSLHNKAVLLLNCGKIKQAFDCAQAAYSIFKQILGSKHPDTLDAAKLLIQIKQPGFRVPSSKKTVRKNNKKGKK